MEKYFQEDTWKNTSNTKDQKYQSIIYRSILVTKEYNNKHGRLYMTSYMGSKNNFAFINNEIVYNLCLSVDALLHKINVLSPIAPTCSSMLTLNGSGQNLKMAT